MLVGFPGGSGGKDSASNVEDPGSIPGLGRFPGEGNGNSLVFLPGESHGQKNLEGYSPRGHKESYMTEWLAHTHTHTHTHTHKPVLTACAKEMPFESPHTPLQRLRSLTLKQPNFQTPLLYLYFPTTTTTLWAESGFGDRLQSPL